MGLYKEQTSIKANAEELRAWRRAAATNGMPLNTWIRCILDHAADVGELHRQLELAAAAQEADHTALMRARRTERVRKRQKGDAREPAA